MKNERMFEVAARTKMRFPFKGLISTEDLWDLPVVDLDKIFKTLNSQMKETKEESLLNVKSKQDAQLEVQIEIVKYIVSVKLEERNIRLKAEENKEKKQQIMALINDKKNAALQNKSVEELENMFNDLA